MSRTVDLVAATADVLGLLKSKIDDACKSLNELEKKRARDYDDNLPSFTLATLTGQLLVEKTKNTTTTPPSFQDLFLSIPAKKEIELQQNSSALALSEIKDVSDEVLKMNKNGKAATPSLGDLEWTDLLTKYAMNTEGDSYDIDKMPSERTCYNRAQSLLAYVANGQITWSSLNPFGRFSSGPIKIYHADKKKRDALKASIQKKYTAPDSDIILTTDSKGGGWSCVMSVDGYSFFEQAALDNENLSPLPSDQAFQTAVDGLTAKKQGTFLGTTMPEDKKANIALAKAERVKTLQFCGCTANDFAAAVFQNYGTNSDLRYEWLHRHAHSLGGADAVDNVVCGTSAANTLMIVLENAARCMFRAASVASKTGTGTQLLGKRAASSGSAAQLGTKLQKETGLKLKLWAHASMEYSIYNGTNAVVVVRNIPMHLGTKVSKWNNGALFALYDLGVFGELAAKNQPNKKPKTGNVLLAATPHLVATPHDPFASLVVDGAAGSGMLLAAEGGSRLAEFDADRHGFLVKELFGGKNCIPGEATLMTVDQQKKFYTAAVALDPGAADMFPDVTKGESLLPSERAVQFSVTVLDEATCVFKGLLRFYDDGKVAYICSIEPTRGEKTFLEELGVPVEVLNQRIVLFRNYDSKAETVRLVAVINANTLLDFLPGGGQKTLTFSGDFEGSAEGGAPSISLDALSSLDATLNVEAELFDGVTLDELQLTLNFVNEVDVEANKQRRVCLPRFGGQLTFDHAGDGENPCVLTVFGEKRAGGGVRVVGSLCNWSEPFGITGLMLDEVTLSVETKPAKLDVTGVIGWTNNDNDFSLTFEGEWSKAAGVGLFAEAAGTMTLADVACLHQRVTDADTPPAVADETAALVLKDVQASFCSKTAKTLQDKECPVGFALHATLTYNGADFEVLILLSSTDGVTVESAMHNAAFGPVTIATLDLRVHFGGTSSGDDEEKKKAEGSYIQGYTDDTIALPAPLGSLEAEVMARLGAGACFKADIKADFSIANISSSLRWLDITFVDTWFSYNRSATEAATLQILPTAEDGSWASLPTVEVPPGELLGADVKLNFLKPLIGTAGPLSLTYDVQKKLFDMRFPTGTGISKAGGSPAMKRVGPSPGAGLDIQLQEVSGTGWELRVSFGAAMTVLDAKMVAEFGFIAVEAAPEFGVSLFGEFGAKQPGQGLAICGGRIMLDDVAVSATVLPEPGALSVQGNFAFELASKKELDLVFAIEVGEDPAMDGFYVDFHATKNPVTFNDMLAFAASMVGIKHFPADAIPFLDAVKVIDLQAYLAGDQGLTLLVPNPAGATVLPPGFGFGAEMEIFGGHVLVSVKLTPTEFAIAVDLPKIEIANTLEVSSYDRKSGPFFHLQLGKTGVSMTVDGAIRFLGAEFKVLLIISIPNKFIFHFYFQVLSLKLRIDCEFSDAVLKLGFEMSAGHREKAREETIKVVMEAAKKMEEDAKAAEAELQAAVKAYNEGLQMLTKQLEIAAQSVTKMEHSLEDLLQQEKGKLHKASADETTAIANIKRDLTGNSNRLLNDYKVAEVALVTDVMSTAHSLTQKHTLITDETTTFNSDLAAAKKRWDDAIKSANSKVSDASSKRGDMQRQLGNIQIPPETKSCGKVTNGDDIQAAKDAKAKAQRDLEDAKANLTAMQQELKSKKQGKDNAITNLTNTYNRGVAKLNDDVDAELGPLASFIQDLTVLVKYTGAPPGLVLEDIDGVVSAFAHKSGTAAVREQCAALRAAINLQASQRPVLPTADLARREAEEHELADECQAQIRRVQAQYDVAEAERVAHKAVLQAQHDTKQEQLAQLRAGNKPAGPPGKNQADLDRIKWGLDHYYLFWINVTWATQASILKDLMHDLHRDVPSVGYTPGVEHLIDAADQIGAATASTEDAHVVGKARAALKSLNAHNRRLAGLQSHLLEFAALCKQYENHLKLFQSDLKDVRNAVEGNPLEPEHAKAIAKRIGCIQFVLSLKDDAKDQEIEVVDENGVPVGKKTLRFGTGKIQQLLKLTDRGSITDDEKQALHEWDDVSDDFTKAVEALQNDPVHSNTAFTRACVAAHDKLMADIGSNPEFGSLLDRFVSTLANTYVTSIVSQCNSGLDTQITWPPSGKPEGYTQRMALTDLVEGLQQLVYNCHAQATHAAVSPDPQIKVLEGAVAALQAEIVKAAGDDSTAAAAFEKTKTDIRAEYGAKYATLETQIAADRAAIARLTHKVLRALANAQTASKKMSHVLEKENNDLSTLSTQVADGIAAAEGRKKTALASAKQDHDDAQQKVDDWKTSKLAKLAASAGSKMKAAAEQGRRAAEIYKRCMENNPCAFASIAGSAEWGPEVLKFNLAVECGLHLHFSIFGWTVNINIGFKFSLTIDLSEIMKLITNAAKLMWDSLKHAITGDSLSASAPAPTPMLMASPGAVLSTTDDTVSALAAENQRLHEQVARNSSELSARRAEADALRQRVDSLERMVGELGNMRAPMEAPNAAFTP